MSIDVTTEKRFEADIEEFFLSPAGGYTHNNDMYDPQLGVEQNRCAMACQGCGAAFFFSIIK